MDDLEAAWDGLHDVVPAGWVVGRPMLREDVGVWEQYAYRPAQKHDAGKRKDEWLATATTEAAASPRWRAASARAARAAGPT